MVSNEHDTPAEHVRDFLTGFMAPTRATDALGQTLAKSLLGPLVDWTDDVIATCIERGRAIRRAG